MRNKWLVIAIWALSWTLGSAICAFAESMSTAMGLLYGALAGGGLAAGGSLLGGFLGKPKNYDFGQVSFTKPSGTATGKALQDRILEALTKGTGIGFPKEYEERATSPFIASREAGWTERELPFLSESYGGRGLGRSTLAARDIGKAYATKERDINELIANAYLNNLTQSKADIGRYENLGLNLAQQEAAVRNQEALANAGFNVQNIQSQMAQDQYMGQLPAAAMSTGLQTGMGIYSAGQQDRLLDSLDKRLATTAASEASPFSSKYNNTYNWNNPTWQPGALKHNWANPTYP